jgi:Phage head-tail joining protein
MLQKRAPALAGLLRETITLQRRALDANGDRLGPWADEFASPARVLHRTVGETVLAQRLAGVQPVEVTLRLNTMSAAVDTDWRFMWLGWAFEITAVSVDELAAVVTVLAVRSRGD